MVACMLLIISSGLSAQGVSVKFYSISSMNTYLSDGIGKNTALTLKYAKGDHKPQYFIMSSPVVNENYISARFLVNLKGTNGKASRLAFINGELYGDGTFILEGVDDNTPRSALFSFRLVENADNDGNFLIESWSNNEGEGEWVKIQNGIPCLVNTSVDIAFNSAADIFNIEQNIAETTGDKTSVGVNPYNVTTDYGAVIIKGATGKSAIITDIYGQKIAQRELVSDEVAISVPSGIAFVAIDNQPAAKVLVK